MKALQLFFSFLLSTSFVPLIGHAANWNQNLGNEVQVNEKMQQSNKGDFPSGWATYPFQMGKVKQVYKIEEEAGKKFIRAFDDKDISMPIFVDQVWDLGQLPILKWKWRAQTLPKGAREDSRDTNDSACGVYVAFGKTSGIALKYVWSSTLPVGHIWEKEPGKFYVIVADSGEGKLNQWQEKSINILEDFKKIYKKEPWKDPTGIGIMTDGNAVHAASGCDYADFRLAK
ncbi:MAG: DUF3047 domain-containing protein [Deltaproteobacteria bacterium]|nr:DUF3047 domain-containing protein [Deltaproteobacteria bacterium]